MSLTHIGPTALAATGIGGATLGLLDIAKAKPLKGAQNLILSLVALDLDNKLQNVGPVSSLNRMKFTLGFAAGVAGLQGILNILTGLREKGLLETINGVNQVAVALIGAMLAYTVPSEWMMISYQVATIGLACVYVIKKACSDLLTARYWPAICKILISIGLIATASYCIYHFSQRKIIPSDTVAFLESHRDEIEKMYGLGQKPEGKWTSLGKGASKHVVAHTDLPKMVFKMPQHIVGFWYPRPEDDLILHVENLEKLRFHLDEQFDQLALPQSYLYRISDSKVVVVEQKFEFEQNPETLNGDEVTQALKQLKVFIEKNGLCDIKIEKKHNARFLSGIKPATIGLFDFDCIPGAMTEVE